MLYSLFCYNTSQLVIIENVCCSIIQLHPSIKIYTVIGILTYVQKEDDIILMVMLQFGQNLGDDKVVLSSKSRKLCH